MQQFDGLVSPALASTQQTELHQTVGHQVVVESDLLLTEHNRDGKHVSSTQKSVYLSIFYHCRTPNRSSFTSKVNLK